MCSSIYYLTGWNGMMSEHTSGIIQRHLRAMSPLANIGVKHGTRLCSA